MELHRRPQERSAIKHQGLMGRQALPSFGTMAYLSRLAQRYQLNPFPYRQLGR
jgi:hypothetical protein